ncbi:hypothetical protein FOA43_002223 [Brettanomyces nanus]|uniref:Vacuolar-sorting protein SNF7 n=1 Tax=Eeniella nana TaxID=13502 RepID=A0A875S0F1_EENNA|nr:uncharacterized protein FOA43_002223 [Brettanomyces nanus]QPG74886.1 hypothetical protein FOA43_002223 [Brettanomyces nanus]
MWSYLFGGGQQKKELPKKAIVQLREHIATLNKKEEYLEKQIDQQDKIARQNVTKNKAVARQALKRKKKLEGDLIKVGNQIQSLETQLNAIESANLNLETMKAMKQGAKAIKQIHSDFNIDKVDETMDDIRDQVEASEEISDAISRPLGTDMVDDDELEEELAEMQQEELDNKMTNTGAKVSENTPSKNEIAKARLPSVPTSKVQDKKQEEVDDEDEDEKALKQLQAEMGM